MSLPVDLHEPYLCSSIADVMPGHVTKMNERAIDSPVDAAAPGLRTRAKGAQVGTLQ